MSAKGDGARERIGKRREIERAPICPACDLAGFHAKGCRATAADGTAREA